MEANAYKEGWGQIIFQTANEMFTHDKLRERAAQVEEQAAVERKWWDAKRARAEKELLQTETSDSDGVLVDANESKATLTNAGKKGGN